MPQGRTSAAGSGRSCRLFVILVAMLSHRSSEIGCKVRRKTVAHSHRDRGPHLACIHVAAEQALRRRLGGRWECDNHGKNH